MAAPHFDRERAIKVLVDAETFGVAKACKRWGVTDQTVRNYRRRLQGDPEFLDALTCKHREIELSRSRANADWYKARQKSLRRTLQRADELVSQETDLDKITRYLDKLGNLDIMGEALGVSGRSNCQSPKASEAPGHDPGREVEDDANIAIQ